MKKFFERLALSRRRLRTFNGRGYVQLIGQPEYSWFRLTPAVMAVEPYSRWRSDLDFERRHGCSFEDTLLTKPKPYVHHYPYGPCTPEQISNYINERAGLL